MPLMKLNSSGEWVDVASVKRWIGDNWEDVYPNDKYTPDNPPDFNNDSVFQVYQVYNAANTFIVPKNGWYRIICIGRSGTVGVTPPVYWNGKVAFPSGGGAGGGTGGTAISNLYLHKDESYTITVNSAGSAFGDLLKATCGYKGGDGEHSYRNGTWYASANGGYGGIGGNGTGGNYINANGHRGGNGGSWAQGTTPHMSGYASQDGHGGEYVPHIGSLEPNQRSCGMGGYAEYPIIEAIKKYHYSAIQNTDVLNKNLVDVTNKRVVYGTSGGYQSPGVFPGCIIIENTIE